MHKYKYISVDPSILRLLAFLDLLCKEHEYIDIDKIQNSRLRTDFNYYKRLYDCIVSDKIRIVLLQHAFDVSKHSETLMSFIKKYCYCSDFNSNNYKKKMEKIAKLECEYFKGYTIRDEYHNAPLSLSNKTEKQQETTKKYAKLMAQSTVEGCIFLTTYQSLVSDINIASYNNNLATSVFDINMLNGYCSKMSNGQVLAPHPVLLRDFGPITKHPERFVTPDMSSGIYKADLVL